MAALIGAIALDQALAGRELARDRARRRGQRRRPADGARGSRAGGVTAQSGRASKPAALEHRDPRVLGVVRVGLRALAEREARAAGVADQPLMAAADRRVRPRRSVLSFDLCQLHLYSGECRHLQATARLPSPLPPGERPLDRARVAGDGRHGADPVAGRQRDRRGRGRRPARRPAARPGDRRRRDPAPGLDRFAAGSSPARSRSRSSSTCARGSTSTCSRSSSASSTPSRPAS